MDSSRPDNPTPPFPGEGADVQDAGPALPLPPLEPGPASLRSRWRRKLAPAAESPPPAPSAGKEGFRSSWREKLKFNKPPEAAPTSPQTQQPVQDKSAQAGPAKPGFRARWRDNLRFNKPIEAPAQEQPPAQPRPTFRSRWKDNLRFNKPVVETPPSPVLSEAVPVTGPVPVPRTEPEVALGAPILQTNVALGTPLQVEEIPIVQEAPCEPLEVLASNEAACAPEEIVVSNESAYAPEETFISNEAAYAPEETFISNEAACAPEETFISNEAACAPDESPISQEVPLEPEETPIYFEPAPALTVHEPEVVAPSRLDTLLAEALVAVELPPAPSAPVAPSLPPPAPEPPAPIRKPVYQPTPRPAGTSSRSSIAVQNVETRPSVRPTLPKHLRVTASQVCLFTRQFAAMTRAGVTVHRALAFYAEGGQEGVLPQVVDEVAYKVASGHRLSQALRHFPDVFSEVYVGLIETAESSSKLDEILERLADLLERQENLRKRVSSILVYPAFLAGASGTAIALFVYYVLPLMGGLFAGLNMELPWPTRMLLSLRQIMPATLAILILSGLVYYFGKFYFAAVFRQNPRLRMAFDTVLLSIPVLGSVCEKLSMSRILYALSNMVDAGLNLSDSMKRCVSVSGNSVIAERLELSRIDLMTGRAFHEALGEHKVFPQACIQMLAVGEETSALDETFHHVARFYEDEIETTLTRFAALIEPVVMAGMGLFVGAIVLSAIMPTVKLLENL